MNIRYTVTDKETRPWGTWEVLTIGENYVIKKIVVLPHKILSLQSHTYRFEHWIILQGCGTVTLEDKIFRLRQNETTFIPKGHRHRIGNDEETPLIFIEIQTGEILDESDIVRYQDEYGRI